MVSDLLYEIKLTEISVEYVNFTMKPFLHPLPGYKTYFEERKFRKKKNSQNLRNNI